MREKDLDGRIKKLEEQMDVPEFETDSTRIAWECLTWREQKLFANLQELMKQSDNDLVKIPEKMLEETFNMSNKALQVIVRRVFDLFQTCINGLYLQNDNLLKFIFWSRFSAFWMTTMNIIEQSRRENEHYKKIEEEYDENWPNDLPKPDYTGIGEKDFNKELKRQINVRIKK